MRLSEWRNNFLAWLGTKINIDSYYLEAPNNVGETNVTLPPLRNIKNYESEGGYKCTATQDVYISTRYSRDLAYHELPLAVIEGTYNTIAQSLLREFQGIADLLDLHFNPTEDAIQAGEIGDNQAGGDWVIVMKFIITIQLVSELETPTEDIRITKVNLGLYRADLNNFTIRTKDWEYVTPDILVDQADLGLVDDSGNLLNDN